MNVATLVARQTELDIKVGLILDRLVTIEGFVGRIEAKLGWASRMHDEVAGLVDEFSRLSKEQSRRVGLMERLVLWGDRLAVMHQDGMERADGTEFTKALQGVRGSLDGILDRMATDPSLTTDHVRDLGAANEALKAEIGRLGGTWPPRGAGEYDPTTSRET